MLDWINELFDQDFIPTQTSVLPRGIIRSLQQLLEDCEGMYANAAQRALEGNSDSIEDPSAFRELYADLHRGVVLKTLVSIAHADRRWNQPEREVAIIVLRHTWGVSVDEDTISKALKNVVKHAQVLKWKELFKPFLGRNANREEATALRALILRLANVIAKADGHVCPAELVQLEKLTQELTAVLVPGKGKAGQSDSADSPQAHLQVAELVHVDSDKPKQDERAQDSSASSETPNEAERERMFADAQQELEGLIGLDSIKAEVRQLIDFLKVQTAREEHRLPTPRISFHTVFEGNPGTGKTTVARIISRLLCGLGFLENGHTVETDRSGLVAQYAGQSGPRTNERIDESLGGVLFIDEAYSLVSDRGDDAYGVEAVQSLLKRMEDDRARFVVVIAGYPKPMKQLLQTNPGLSSRFQRTLTFEDYTPKELLRIFYSFCKKYHYRLPKESRIKLLRGFDQLLKRKSESFGNGRVARNLFEDSIRRMSTRIVSVSPLTREALTTIQPEDIEFDSLEKG